ncbi:MAG: 3-phosphoshikimate 1-carboxyvinyltransferase [Longimicrobiales bacterium]|nr:3-phosphoshikimate 1-carboxyvinyltransferase [Longimicrobiales bacterium]
MSPRSLRVPGDKSLTQRAFILAGLAEGGSRLRGVLCGADSRSTAAAVRALGAGVPEVPSDGAEIRITGRGLGGWTSPAGPLDLGNSGTGSRLLLGALAGCGVSAVVTGDASLRSRPMKRVTDPLSRMGARFEWIEAEGRLPVRVTGGGLHSVDLDLPVASAQVKSALLLAGLTGGVPVHLTEPDASRDHTERMLTALGVRVLRHASGPGVRIELRDPPASIPPLDLRIPGDPSSAAFFVLAALLGVAREVEIHDVGLNPTRTGGFELLERMGARVEFRVESEEGGEPTGTIAAAASELTAIEVRGDEVVRAIDELPVIAVAAARAHGTTRIRGAGELRHKETDRIRALVENLRAVGVGCDEHPDGLDVTGTDAPLAGRVDAMDDHRIAMVFGVLAAEEGNAIEIAGGACVDVSFPGFWEILGEVAR